MNQLERNMRVSECRERIASDEYCSEDEAIVSLFEELESIYRRLSRAEKVVEAARCVLAMKGMTLLGHGTHEEGAAQAFYQCADYVEAALRAYDAGKEGGKQ